MRAELPLAGALALALAGRVAAGDEARTWVVGPAGGPPLAQVVAGADDGDTVVALAGVHRGPVEVTRRVTLEGREGAVIDGGGRGTVVRLAAAGAVLRGVTVVGSGASLERENSGVTIDAAGALVEGNRIVDCLFGVYARRAAGSVVRGNVIVGKDLDVPRRGDPIRVWYSDDVTLEGNVVERGRDVVLWYSTRMVVRGNVIRDGRYGLHFMYCDDGDIAGNRLVGNSVGAFLMYGRRLRMHHNVLESNRGPSGYGLGLKDMDDARITDNLLRDNRVGAYVDNSPREVDSTVVFERNVILGNDVGVLLLPLVRRNIYLENSFVDNGEQVAVTGGGELIGNTWALGGRGNYWSDYAGYDADGDGVGDVPYEASRLFERLADRDPHLRLFLFGPATDAVNFAARAVPLVRPRPKLRDEAPLMAPVLPTGLPVAPVETARPLLGSSLALAAAGLVTVLVPVLPWLARRRAPPAAPPHDAARPLVEVARVTKRFGRLVALDRLSFTIRAGEAVALWGANGAGKTTALRCLLGVIPFEGDVRLDGLDVRARGGRAARARLGFVPQELGLHDDLGVRETLRFYGRLKGVAPAEADGLLEPLGLAPHAPKRVGELSGGLKQRLALALALLGDPPLLLLDEPTANLDARARGDLLELLGGLRARGKTLVFSSHRLDEVSLLADRVLVLEQGRLAADLPSGRLPAHLGLRSVLHLTLPEVECGPAVDLLAAHGFAASRSGTTLSVAAPPREKGRPIALLVAAGLHLEDFELGREAPARRGEEAR
ncbi:MAG: nitrous oxide reductase family maturation protein NosD [Planctomycetes bacterium]|nr:nitrous oxide reductase family maturation protein NosD [Planctomycetota bacterium]